MHILSRVASAWKCGGAVYTQPYALTLWQFIHTREDDRIRELIARSQQIDAATLTYVAFHEPEKLQEQYTSLERDLGTLPTREEALADADKLMKRLAVIDEKRKQEQALFAAAEAKAKKTGRN